MLIARQENWYRPYFIEASGRTYKVEKIHFYEDDKILVSTNSGWLEKVKWQTTNDIVTEDIKTLELPIDEIKVKRKEKFNGEVFAISKGKEDYGTDLIAELYIPAEMLDIHFIENVIKYKCQVYAIYKGANEIYIEKYIKSIDGELQEIAKQYEEIYKTCERYNLGYHTEETIENLNKLKDLAKQYIEAKKQMESLTIDDVMGVNKNE